MRLTPVYAILSGFAPDGAPGVGTYSRERKKVYDARTASERANKRVIEDRRTRALEEVGKEFNVMRERIRQIEAKALRKLQHLSRSKKLKDFLN